MKRWLGAILAVAAALILVALLAPFVPLPGPERVALLAAGILAFVCVSTEVLFVASRAPAVGPRALWGLIPAMALLVGVALAGDVLPRIVAACLVTIGILSFGTLAGAVVGGAIHEAGYLLVVAVISALVDVFSVLHPRGPTAQLIQIEAAVNVLILPWPILGSGRIEPVLGVGDVAFAAIYLVATRRHGLSVRKTVIALAAGLAVTLVVVVATGVGIPALPFLGVAVVLAHPEARRLPKKDRATALLGLGALVIVLGALFLLR